MKQGFTLIELLVVVLIIGILASVAIPKYSKAVEKARAANAIQVLQTALKAETAYKEATDNYTRYLDNLDIVLPGESISDGIIHRTEYFEYIGQVPTNDTLLITAQRGRTKGNFFAGTGENTQYTISLSIDANGEVRMWCQTEKPTQALTADITSGASEICKAIAGGHAGGMIK